MKKLESELNSLSQNKCSIINSGATGGRIINELQYLANFCVREVQGLGRTINGNVLFAKNSYVTSLGRYANFNSRNAIRDSYKAYADYFDRDRLFEFQVDIPRNYYFQSLNLSNTVQDKECLEAIKDQILQLRKRGVQIGVLLIETITSDKMLCISEYFLVALSKLLRELKVFLVVDDIMAGIRCGEVFSHLLYKDFVPDFVLIGKAFLFSMLVAINKHKDKAFLLNLYNFAGFPTSPMDSMVIRKSIEICRIIRRKSLLNNIKLIGKEMNEHLLALCKKVNKSNEIYEKAVFGGVGCMWYTNLDLYSENKHFINSHGRLFPHITIDPSIVKILIKTKMNINYLTFNELSFF